MTVRVECYAGYRGEETPRAFVLGDRRVEVVQVLDRWLTPENRYFRVQGDDGGLYLLWQDIKSGEWEMTVFDRRM
jgi:hypothetical protein